jgi:hypothetical protein
MAAANAMAPTMALSNLPGPWVWTKRNGKYWRVHPQQQIWDGPHAVPPPLNPPVALLNEEDWTLHRCSQFHLVTACGVESPKASVGPLGLLHLKSRRLCPECWSEP